MFSWKQYILSVIICLFSCGIVSQIISDTKRRELINLICGTVLAVSILGPLTRVNLEEYLRIPQEEWSSADSYIAAGKIAASSEQKKCIKDACEAYILDKAKVLDAGVTVEISLNELLVPVFAEINGEATDPDIQKELQNILTTDLGIPKENQKWIWNQESNGS